MNPLLQYLPQILPAAADWISFQQSQAANHGRKLSMTEMKIATIVDVQVPEKVHVLVVPEIPAPESGILQWANEQVELVNIFTIGLPVGYGILLKAGHEDDARLLAHELVHVGQYERLGGVAEFLKV